MIKENFWPVQLELCLTNFVGTFFQLVNINIDVYLYTLKTSLFYSLFRCLKQETVLQVCLVTKTYTIHTIPETLMIYVVHLSI